LLATPVSGATHRKSEQLTRQLPKIQGILGIEEAAAKNAPANDTDAASKGNFALLALNTNAIGLKHAFIGGGCCVHLSVEYMPEQIKNAPCAVIVIVEDSENTLLAWSKKFDAAQSGYKIQEDIITTNPGAKLMVYVVNAVARVRWCEVFSC